MPATTPPAMLANPRRFTLRASAIAAFKACPTRFRLACREGLVPAEDTDATRMGTTWHELHEVYAKALNDCAQDLPSHEGSEEEAKDAALNAVVQLLNTRYANPPLSKTPHDWAVERQILLTSFIGYLWYWQNDPVEVLASEVPFELPLTSPRTGLPLPTDEVVRAGTIDQIVRWQGAVCVLERKSTSRVITPDSDYWDKAKKDTQVSMYALTLRDMRNWNSMQFLVGDQEQRYGNTLYDVWHKPTIRPAPLTQKETAEFLYGPTPCTYCGQEFRVHLSEIDGMKAIQVGGEYVEVEPGKKGFAIKETVEMFGARLLQDIQQRPDHYYARREIVRTDAELRQFERQLYSVYQSMKACDKYDAWIENEQQCRATFKCPYIPICYGDGADSVCDGETTPDRFKRIFVDLTVNGQMMEE